MITSTIVIWRVLACFTLFACASFMILSPKIKDGVVLKLLLIAQAMSTFMCAITYLEGNPSEVLDTAVLVSIALVSITHVARALRGTSILLE